MAVFLFSLKKDYHHCVREPHLNKVHKMDLFASRLSLLGVACRS